MFETPILFLIFNRPETTRKVFERIREIRPSQLFVAADGPSSDIPEDSVNCRITRDLVLESVDWQCEVKTLFRDSNLGCKKAVSEALDWFFDSVQYGVVIEDDCLPSRSFFPFCENLLSKYMYDQRVWHISGCNHNINSKEDSYYFSHHIHIWGWASWSRAWKHYDPIMTAWPDFKRLVDLEEFFGSREEKERRVTNWDRTYDGTIQSWDYQWSFNVLSNGGLSILPSQNLVENLGFGDSATHTKEEGPGKLEGHDIHFPLRHPKFVVRNNKLDRKYGQKNRPAVSSRVKNIINRIA